MISILMLLLVSAALLSQDPLEGYLEKAAGNNPELQARFNEYMAALEKVPQAKALPDPQVVFAYFIRPVETRMGPQRFRISASQYFPWFGTLKAAENAAVQEARMKYEAFEETRAKLFSDLKSVYYNLYLTRRSAEITLESLELLGSIRQIATVKVASGEASMVDEYRVQMEINEMENQLALLRDRESVLVAEFSNLVNSGEDIFPEVPDDLDAFDFPLDKSAALDSVLQKNHSLLEIEFQQAALAFRKDEATRKGLPGIRIGLDYTVIGPGETGLPGTDALVFPSVGVSIPLYRNKYRAMVREIVYLEEANRQAGRGSENRLETLFERTWKEYTDAGRRIRLYASQSQLARDALKLLEAEYTTAGSGFEEVLRMERSVLKYHLEFERARADKLMAIAYLNYLMGN